METPEIDYSRKWFVLSAVGMGIFLATIDGSIVNVALPTLAEDLSASFALVQWVVLAYLLTITTLMLSFGRYADMIGKKPIYVTGFAVFTVGSVLCGLAPNVQWLIGFRVLQAVGAAMLMALGMAIITEAFPPQERGRALGISGAIVSIGIVLGPTLGGLIIKQFSWHWIFFVNLPVGVAGTWMARRYVPAIRPEGGQKFDFVGALTLLLGLLAFLLGLTLGPDWGFADGRVLGLLAAAAFFLGLFVFAETRVEQPMVDLRLFRNSLFTINLATGFISFISIAGTLILMPFYLENVLGYATDQVGLLLAVVPISLGLTAPISGSLSDRYGSRPITMIGLAVLTAGFLAVRTISVDTTAVGYVLRFLPVGLGLGIFQSPNNSAIMGTAPRRRLGIVSGMLAITRTLGQTTGIAILGAVWSSRVFYHAGQVLPAGATTAPAADQVAGLQDTFLLVVVLVFLGFVLATWALIEERRQQRAGLAGQPAAPVSAPDIKR
ncbi:MAG TPA: MFS transporter [Anaerolineales bacterium]|nr:MFS transporter [Anaerolineales bacterium]